MDKYAFGNYLTDLRTQRGLSQSELGAIVGVSNKAISKWENGEALPRLERLKALADYFGVPVEELVAGGKASEDAPKADLQSPQPIQWDGVTSKEAQRRLDLQAAYRQKQATWALRWTKLLLCCDPIGLGMLGVAAILMDGVQNMRLGIVFAILSLSSIFINRLVWRGYESVRLLRIVGCFALMVQCFPIVRDIAALSNGWQNALWWLICVLYMAFSAANLYMFAIWRPVRDFLTEQSYYRHL